MKNKVIFFGDSIIRYEFKNKISDWTLDLKKLLKLNQKKNNYFKTFSYIGLNSNQAIKILPNILKKNKKTETLVIQLGINDSWHFKSLQGKPNISTIQFKKNLQKIYKKSKYYKIKNLVFLTYHKLLKKRIEINNKTVNQNLFKYIKIIKTFCKQKRILCIDIYNETKKIKTNIICLKLPDGVHLSKKGTYIYSKIVYKKLGKIL